MNDLMLQGVVYLAAAVVAVPLATRAGLGSVLGYLTAGVLLGPFAMGLVGDAVDVMHFAELGVVMMLFTVGLELDPGRLWRMRGPVFGLGGAQVVGTAAVFAAIGVGLGVPWQQAVAIGFILAMSSTAIALQSLAERSLLGTQGGQTTFAILLLQDVAVIPLLSLFPLLATLEVHHGGDDHGGSLIAGLPAWAQGVAVLGAIGAVVLGGRLAITPLLRAVARTGMRELFTAAALLIVLAVALLMGAVGLSPALGAFVAGVVLAGNEYRHELESDIAPFKGLLLGLFFMAVGASVDLGVMTAQPGAVLGLVAGVIAVKVAVLALVARWGGLSAEQGALVAMSLGQVGEFAFVLLQFTADNGIVDPATCAVLVAVTAVSMALSPFLLLAHERVLAPRLAATSTSSREHAVEDEGSPVIIAGCGRFGQITGRLLRNHGVATTVLEVDGDQVDMLGRFGHKVFYGDASRLDLLHAAGAARARVLVVAVDQHDKVMAIVHAAQRHFPHLAIVARARGRTEAYELVHAGVEGVYRETFDTALSVGVHTLRLLGMPAHTAWRAAQSFRRLDEHMLRELAEGRDRDDEAFVGLVRARLRDVEQTLRAELATHTGLSGPLGWDDGPPLPRPEGARGEP